MSYLIVAAHPDDEVLGAGATMYKLVQQGEDVNVCVLVGEAKARSARPKDSELRDDMLSSMRMLGVKEHITGDFPNIELNTVPHIRLVQFIEEAIRKTGATRVITHFPTDLNNDHLHTSLACQEAVRQFQRRNDVAALQELWYMEVQSATDWGLNDGMNRFVPNLFVEIGEDGIKKKLEALRAYRGVMRDYPHPRSNEAITGLAAYRGAQAGCHYAEAFMCAFRRLV